MKTVLFGITMEGLSAESAKNFEIKTMSALKSGSRDFVDAVSIHVDYKEGIAKMVRQYAPDCIILNESLPGQGDIFSIIKDLKSDFPSTVFTVLLKKARSVGDADLANLTACGVYNWVIAPWTSEAVSATLISPKKLKDVEMFMPTFKSGAGGLLFETKEVEKKQNKLEDLDVDILSSGTNNAVKTEKIVDDIESKRPKKNSSYHKIMAGGFGFKKKSFKPVQDPKEKPTLTNDNIETPEEFKSMQAEINSEPVIEEAPAKEDESKSSLLDALNKVTSAHEESKINEKPQAYQSSQNDSDDFTQDDDEDEAPSKDESAYSLDSIEEKQKETPRTSKEDKIKKFAEISKKNDEAQEEIKVQENIDEKTEQVEEAPILKEEEVEAPKEAKPNKHAKTEDAKPAKKSLVTLSTITFTPKYKKVLFLRALPISSVVPAHVAKLSNAAFVDFNKHSNNDGYFEVHRTTIKEASMPDAEYIVGDVVAGNGVEELVKKFDHVIAVLPEDAYEIMDFVKRYEGLYHGMIIDRCTTSSLTRKQLLTMAPNAKYIDTVKVDNCNKEVVQSAITHDFLMNNPDFAEGMHYFLKDIGGVKWI